MNLYTLFASLVVCSVAPTFAHAAMMPQGGAAMIDVSVVPGAQSPVSFRTFPAAQCTFPVSGKAYPVMLYAERDGTATFYVSTLSRGAAPARELLKCVSAGRTQYLSFGYHIGVNPAAVFADKAPAAAAMPSDTQINQAVAHLGFDPRTATSDLLDRHNMPPMPQQDVNSPGYRAWLQAVTTPTTRVETTGLGYVPASSRPPHSNRLRSSSASRRFASAGSYVTGDSTPNWSGFIAGGSQGSLNTVQGYFTSPPLIGGPQGEQYMTMWVGIDGAGGFCLQGSCSQNVFQNGVAETSTNNGSYISNVYYTWREDYPSDPSEVYEAGNGANNQNYCTVYKVINANIVYAKYYCKDLSTGVVAAYTQSNVGASFVGDTAEWVVERPATAPNQYLPLANYGSAVMTGAEAKVGSTYYNYADLTQTGINVFQVNMLSRTTNNVLSTSSGPSSSQINYSWVAIQ